MRTTIEDSAPPLRLNRAATPSGKRHERALGLKTVLVPLDFSRASFQALKYSIPLAKEFDATIHLVHVQPADELTAISNAGGLMLSCVDAIALMQDRLREALGRQGRFWPDNCHVVTGRPFEEICNLARDIGADLIVLPTRGLSRLKHVILGSTAERVVRYAPCPVLVPRGPKFKATTWNGGAGLPVFRLGKILVPVDFSKCSLAGLNYAARLARDTGATLRLFHAVFPYTQAFAIDRVGANATPLIKTATATARKEMDRLVKTNVPGGVSSEAEIRVGSAIDEICAESSRPGIDLVVTSTHGHTGFKRALLGSVAEHVVRYAECPVLTVPSRGGF